MCVLCMCMLVFKHIYGLDDVFSHKKGTEVKSMQTSEYGGQKV